MPLFYYTEEKILSLNRYCLSYECFYLLNLSINYYKISVKLNQKMHFNNPLQK